VFVLRYVEDYASLQNDAKVFYRCVIPDKFFVMAVLLHGYTSHSGAYLHVGKELANYGYAVCLYDQRGHGKTASERDRGYIDSFEDYLKDLENFTKFTINRFGGEKTVLIGHSMGGLVVLLYTAKYGRVGDAVVGIAPAVLIPAPLKARITLSIMSFLTPRKRIRLPFTPEQIEEGMKRIDKELIRGVAEDPLVLKDTTVRLLYEIWRASREFWRYVYRISKPLLLIHGDQDNIIPLEASRKTFEKARSKIKILKIYPGKGHSPIHEIGWRDCVKDIAEWVNRVLLEQRIT
jgi:alpha-beta hydrolase superfamily lysophospholipase